MELSFSHLDLMATAGESSHPIMLPVDDLHRDLTPRLLKFRSYDRT